MSLPADAPAPMTRRQVLEALTGLLLAMFVSMIATTVISTSLPVIVLAAGDRARTGRRSGRLYLGGYRDPPDHGNLYPDLGQVGGPLLGGFITDAINWRWNFFVSVPVAVAEHSSRPHNHEPKSGCRGRTTRRRGILPEHISPGLMPMTYRVFTTIANNEPVAASTVVDELSSDKALVSRAVRELEGLGLIQREPDLRDRRSFLLSLSNEGHVRLEKVRAASGGRFTQNLAEWQTKDIQHLAQLLAAWTEGRAPTTR